MSWTFARPVLLLLLVLLVPVIWLATGSAVDLPRWRLRLVTALRAAIVTLIVLALAGLSSSLPAEHTTVVFVVDRSLSVGGRALPWAQDYLRRAHQVMGDEDRIAILAFGAETMTELPPSHPDRLPALATQVDRGASEMATALRFALATVPSDSAARVVLLSDGNETGNTAVQEAEVAAELGVEIWTVPMPTAEGAEVLVEALEVPDRPLADTPFDARVVVASDQARTATLTLERNGQAIARQQVELLAGRNVFLLPQRLEQPGFFEYSARISSPQDTNPANNKAQTVALVSGPARLLYVVDDLARPGPIPALLSASGVEVEVRSAGTLPSQLAAWQNYQAVVLDDVSAFAISSRQQQWISALVKETGMGLAVIGGRDAYGVGGYLNTPFEPLLPVELDIRKQKKAALVALALCIDKSGSMGGGPDSNMALAREGAIAAATLLHKQDQLGVLGFDSAAKWVVPMGPAANKKKIIDSIASLRAGGGTDLYPALRRALDALRGAEVPLRHVIVLSDGAVAPNNYQALAQQAVKQQISISTVAVGQGADVTFLSDLASWGKGRTYYTDSGHMLPRIFTRDTVIASRAAYSEEPFQASLQSDHPILRGLDFSQAPALAGYNLTSQKNAPSQTLLAAKKGDPLLAVGRAGLGKTMAWTSDNGGLWALPWVDWPGYSKLMVQALRHLLPDVEKGGLQAALGQGSAGEVRLQVETPAAVLGHLEGRVIAPDGSVRPLSVEQQAPRTYSAGFTPDRPGSWLVHLSDPEAGTSITRVWNVPYSPEHRRLGVDRQKLQAIANAGQGRYDPPAEETFATPQMRASVVQPLWRGLLLAALLLLPLEVGIRRVFLPRRTRRTPVAEATKPAETHLDRLMSAKEASRPVRPQGRPQPLPKLPLEHRESAKSEAAHDAESQPQPVLVESPLERLKRAKERARRDTERD